MKEDVSRKLVKDIFPNEIWEYVHGVYVAKTRKAYSEKSKNAKQIFEKEMDTAKILVKNGCSVWLLPENRANMKNPDAVVDGLIYDFKQVKFSRVEHGFLEGLRQAKNVVIRLNGDFSVRRIFGKLKSHFHNRDGRLIIILNKKIYSVNFGDRRQ